MEKLEENKRPVQKVVPSRVNKSYVNGNVEYPRANGDPRNGDRGQSEAYIKPTSPTKSPTNTLYNGVKSSIPRMNGDAKLLSVSYLKGAPKSKLWTKEASEKLSFTMKREFDKQKEETELLQQLRSVRFNIFT